MFERYTEPALQVVVLAQEEARRFGHNYVGTEHLLLGLVRERNGIAARTLHSLGLTADGARRDVARLVGRGESERATVLRFTQRAKRVLELSVEEASALGHGRVGTEHVLLGLAGVSDGLAVTILRESGLDGERVRNEVLWQLGGSRWT